MGMCSKKKQGGRIFIAGIIPKNLVHQYAGIAQSEINFSEKFISAIQPDCVYSIVPINIVKKTNFVTSFNNLVRYIQIRIFSHYGIGRLLNSLLENGVVFFKLIPFKGQIWLYNVRKQNLFLIILLYVFRKKFFVVLADFNPPTSKWSLNTIFLKLLDKSAGIISLSNHYIAISNNKNIQSLPGIADAVLDTKFSATERNRKTILYAGNLYLPFGIDLALEVFAGFDEYELLITGSGSQDIIELVEKYSLVNSNIKYLGYLSYTGYLNILDQVDVCLSLRNPTYKENLYNFPSKVIEFLTKGKFVVSTLCYESIEEGVLFTTNYTKEGVRQRIIEITSLTNMEASLKREKNKEFIKQKMSLSAWNAIAQQIETA